MRLSKNVFTRSENTDNMQNHAGQICTEAGWDKVLSQASPRIMSAMQHKIQPVHVV